MTIEQRERRIAIAAWGMAAGMIEYRDPSVRDLARAALERPCAATIRPLIEAGQGKGWLPSLMDALAQVGVAAADEILGY